MSNTSDKTRERKEIHNVSPIPLTRAIKYAIDRLGLLGLFRLIASAVSFIVVFLKLP